MTLQESSPNIDLVVTYDSLSKSCAIQGTMSGSTMQMAIESDSASTAHGVYAGMSFIMGGSTYSVSGYADDNGGLVKTVFNISSDGYSSYFIEGFDSTGNLRFAETSSNDSTWIIDTTYSDIAPADRLWRPGVRCGIYDLWRHTIADRLALASSKVAARKRIGTVE